MSKDKEVQLNFNYSDGTTDTVSFLVPAGDNGDAASICDAFTTLPTSDSFGDDPQIIVRSGGVCRAVTVPSKGIFTDIRSAAAFSGIALEGETNTFVATARNVSVLEAGKVRVDIVLPVLPDGGIVYGDTTISAPTGIVVTPIITTGSNRSYQIENLISGVDVKFNTPITWNVKGAYQASVTVNAVDPNTIDYSSTDDYSVASYTVAPKSEGEATVDCPLIYGSVDGVGLAIGSAQGATVSDLWSKCLGVLLDEENSFVVKFNRPVSIYSMQPAQLFAYYDIEQNANGLGAVSYVVGDTNTAHQITPLDGTNTKFKITFKKENGFSSSGLPTQTMGCFGIKAGANCNTQYFVISGDAGYKIGQTIALVNNGDNEPVSATKTTQFSQPKGQSHEIRHTDGTTHTLLFGSVGSGGTQYKVEGMELVLKQGVEYDLTLVGTTTPDTLIKKPLVTQYTVGAVTITYTEDTNTARIVTTNNTTEHDSTTNGLIKCTFVQ